MNKFFLGLGILATSMAMVSCSQDDFDNTVNKPSNDGSSFYTQFTISLPTAGSRADNYVGEEFGQEGENKINNLTLVLMDKQADDTYKFVASTVVTNVSGTNSNVKPTYQAVFKGEQIKNHYENSDVRKLWMFVVANPVGLDVNENFDPATSTFTTEMLIGYKEGQAITMSGAPYQVTLPETIEELMKYDTNSHPYNLTAVGAVPVERSIARFDFKSINTQNADGLNDVYEIKDKLNGNKVIGTIKLLDMAVVNERTEAYYFGRSSANGLNTGINFQLVSNINSYVVSPMANDVDNRTYYSTFNPEVISTPALNQTSGYKWTKIADVTGDSGVNDEDNSWNKPNAYGDYKIWRYVNENTIPFTGSIDSSTTNNNQKYGNTTGVIFRGTILDPDSNIPGYGDGAIYLFQNELFGNFEALKEAALSVEDDGSVTNPVMKYYFLKTWGNPASAEEDVLVEGMTPAMNGFTVYQNEGTTDAPLYYTYYYYWNRHLDNGKANLMGHMEFAVVRNNVYKLAVTSINRFGHTTKPGDDPDPVDPDDPDEDEDIYFRVDVTVLPWTVRVNDIEF